VRIERFLSVEVYVDDMEGIRRLTHDYAWFVDTFDIEGLMLQFTEDAVFDATPVGLVRLDGAGSIRAFFEDEFLQMSHQMHSISNHRIDLAGDSATGIIYFAAQGVAHEGGGVSASGYYEDRYERTPTGWRIRERRAHALVPPDVGLQAKRLEEQA
jgi:ketosteroid isomerase-like protein